MVSKRISSSLKLMFIQFFFNIIFTLLGLIKIRMFLLTYGSEINGVYQLLSQLSSYFLIVDFGFSNLYLFKMYKSIDENDDLLTCKLFNGCKKDTNITMLIMFVIMIMISFLFPSFSKVSCQIPPHSGHPCPQLMVPTTTAHSGLSPPS